MTEVRASISVSVDGFVAGPNDSRENPLGDGGERLHEWIYDLASWREVHGLEGGETGRADEIFSESIENVGAVVMGRRMFDNGEGPWQDDPFEGHWGEDPPFGVPVFVLTHHEREPLELGETTFTFVTEGIESAVELAREVAGDAEVSVAGGASTIQQCVEAGLLDELELHLVPVVLGDGVRLFGRSDHDGIELERTRVVESPVVTHLTYRVPPRADERERR
ncbi:dihydrofolate reductase family protein [Halostagnicola sp. A-GB9-2]|uniref:dihydrofolate reductase family protein n=1 Tax=Halostagnicola sp. A-GB9-2 TaxID=3048066 RepID=UPI0024BFA0ED|nr:dihydrofolate reductase family protein [Halostagnicola sp. A-GB9-2]MDJ1434700.1 dihydrofolate reductase family protein [Halostagnicola sp. A-GB9-2]